MNALRSFFRSARIPTHASLRLAAALVFCAGAVGFVRTPSAIADEVVLKSGDVHEVEIASTEADSVTVRFQRGDTSGTLVLRATDLDPHSFYELRNENMEATAENHLKLARFAVEHGLFARARLQVDKARALDPEYVERKMETAELIEGVAANVLAAARRIYEAGEVEEARQYAAIILTYFPETDAAGKASALLAKLEEKLQAADMARQQAAMNEAKQAGEEAANRVQQAFEKDVKPLVASYHKARETNLKGLQEQSSSKSIKSFEAAGRALESVLEKALQLRKKYAQDDVVTRELNEGIRLVKAAAVDAYVNAGGVEMSRGSFNNAHKFAAKALAVDPQSSAARSFKSRVELAEATSDKYMRSRRR